MEYDISGIKRVLKKVAIVLLMVILLGTSIIIAFLFVVEQEKVVKLKEDRKTLEIRIEAAENKIDEQKIEIEAIKNNKAIEEVLSNTEILPTEALLKNELAELKNGDEDTIRKWFGYGNEYTSENAKRFTKYTKITVTKNKTTSKGYIRIHVCNIDNRKLLKLENDTIQDYIKKNVAMKESDRNELVAKKLNEEIDNGNMDRHYSLEVTSNEGVLEITDELKQALTGGWYYGSIDEMQSYKCIFD